ncbi:lytic transglycosylase domain-containing protein [Skermania piniformis]|uniref:lytic transglycosylase domain-containing protein n=1 Tax=Skermania pinensis TaxID=39122 RepID=UPI000836CFF4|nr:lytic murein transglycosylase [Skermania piniformis]
MTVSALVLAGLVTAGTAAGDAAGPARPETIDQAGGATLAESTVDLRDSGAPAPDGVGVLPAEPKPARMLRAAGQTPADGATPFAAGSIVPFAAGSTVALPAVATPVRGVSIPAIVGALGIPENVLAAYRNAELAMAAAEPSCGLSWSLLAGIGRIESGHANGGKADVNGTTSNPIMGPALDGTLAGNEVIRAANGSAVRALGPMQFLPSTWQAYSADANADGAADPNNIYDAALGAGKYLCAGGMNLRDPSQELRAVLRYNNSMAYASNVLSWAASYRNGVAPTMPDLSADLVAPGGLSPVDSGGPLIDAAAVGAAGSPAQAVAVAAAPGTPGAPGTAAAPGTAVQPGTTTAEPSPSPSMITVPGLPPIPCAPICSAIPTVQVPGVVGEPAPAAPAAPAVPAAPVPAPVAEPAPAPALPELPQLPALPELTLPPVPELNLPTMPAPAMAPQPSAAVVAPEPQPFVPVPGITLPALPTDLPTIPFGPPA